MDRTIFLNTISFEMLSACVSNKDDLYRNQGVISKGSIELTSNKLTKTYFKWQKLFFLKKLAV
jgi:hypothetical protein